MKTAFLFFFFLIIAFSLKSYGALPPTTLSGMDDATKTTTFNFKVPNKQVTKVTGGTLIEGIDSNYIQNPGFEGLTDSTYSTYADAAGVEPVDGTGGSPTVAFASSTLSPLRGLKSGNFVKDAVNRQGEGFSTDFTIDPSDKTKIVSISFDYESSVNYVDGDMRIYVYDVTNSRMIELLDRDLMASANGTYTSFFQASPDSINYRLIAHIASTSALQYTVKFDTFKASPKAPAVKGQIVLTQSSFFSSTAVFNNTIFKGTLTDSEGSGLYSYDSVTGIYTALKKCAVTLSVSASPTSAVAMGVGARFVVSGVNKDQYDHTNATTGLWAAVTHTRLINPGDTFYGHNATIVDTGSSRVSVTAVYVSDNVTLSEDAGNRELIGSLTLSSNQIIASSSATKVILNSIASNTSSMASTANSRIDILETGYYDADASIQILDTSLTVGETYLMYIRKNGSSLIASTYIGGSGGSAVFNSKVLAVNLVKGDYIELFVQSTTDTSYTVAGNQNTKLAVAKRSSPQTIAASETVAFIGENIAGTSVANTGNTLIPFSTVQKDTHNAYNTTTGQYIVPASGTYSISVGLLFNGLTYSSGNRAINLLYKNGSQFRSIGGHYGLPAVTTAVSTTGSATIFLERGDVLELRAANDRTGGATPLNTFPGTNHLSIVRVGN